MIIIIYDTGGVYAIEVDPANPPEWITRNAGMMPKARQYIQAQKQIGDGIKMLTDRLEVK